ncbi:helix-turn-helix transcriptional regulator [Roseibium algae]|uniref:Metalloregulator ArsR/SmtB family transcription factor n=1 Tax=Roseibium algae TaxID=3123038 RepID=A0ABU8TM22_9HYPH
MSDRTKTRLLNALKTASPQTAANLAKREGVTSVAARQHLDSLLSEGLVDFEDIKGEVGRPKRVWSLTAQGHARFPDNHSGLIVGLLDGLKSLYGEEGIERLIAHREADSLQTYSKALDGKVALKDKLQALADVRSSEGYMASVEQDADTGGYLLIENHCSICAAATACQGFCRSEMSLFRQVLGEGIDLTRVEHLLSGGRRCVYRVKQAA